MLKETSQEQAGSQTPLLYDESGNDQEEGPTGDGHEEVEKQTGDKDEDGEEDRASVAALKSDYVFSTGLPL